jgi:glucan phosphoethanolaminetransferase (alkaline phosphatase superfamily)
VPRLARAQRRERQRRQSAPCLLRNHSRCGAAAALGTRECGQENLLEPAQRAGLAVLWGDNRSGCKGLCDGVGHAEAIDTASGSTAPPPSGPDAAITANPLLACLSQRRELLASRDQPFHAVLGPFGVASSEYQKVLDAFAPCREL